MTTTFHISAPYRDLLERAGLANFEALFGFESGVHVDGHGDRSVTRLELPGEAGGRRLVFYLKREWNPKAAMLIRRWVAEGFRPPPSRSVKEWRNLHALRRREIATAEPVAVGEERRRGFFSRAFLLVREVEESVNLAEFFEGSAAGAGAGDTVGEPLSVEARRALASQVASMVRTMHDRGMAFNDLYLKHIYVNPSRPGGRFRPTLIDAQRSRRFWHMMPTARWHDLAALYATSHVAGCRRTDRLKFLLAYSRQSRLSPPVKLMVRRILARAERISGRGGDPRQTVSRREAPAGMPSISDLNIHFTDRQRILASELYLPELRRLGLDTVERVMGFEGGESYREKAGRQTVRVEIRGLDGQPSAIYLKRHHEVDTDKLLDGLLHWRKPQTRADIEYRNIVRLQDHGLATATPVARGEDQRWGRRQDSFLMTEEIPDAEPADDYFRGRFALLTAGDRRDGRQSGALSASSSAMVQQRRRRDLLHAKRQLIAAIARTARKFHGSGFYHRDFYLCHFFIRELVPLPDSIGSPSPTVGDAEGGADTAPVAGPDDSLGIEVSSDRPLPQWSIHLIDLQRVRFAGKGRVGRRWIVKDLAALDYSAPAKIISRSDKLRFMRAYLGQRKFNGEARRLIGAVLRKSARIARHDHKMRQRGET